jgi:hypothetical protein
LFISTVLCLENTMIFPTGEMHFDFFNHSLIIFASCATFLFPSIWDYHLGTVCNSVFLQMTTVWNSMRMTVNEAIRHGFGIWGKIHFTWCTALTVDGILVDKRKTKQNLYKTVIENVWYGLEVWHFKENTRKQLLAVEMGFGGDWHRHQGMTEYKIT